MKVTPVYDYRKDGSKNIKSYKATLTKSLYEKAGFTADTEFDVEYEKEKIILKLKK